MSPDAPPVLAVEALRKAYGATTAVDGVSFEVRPGEIVGLLGPNGAGKTTTIDMILGVLAPSAGAIRIDGVDVQARRAAALERTNFAAVYAPLPGNLTVEQNLRYFAALRGLPRRAARERIAALLQEIGLADKAKAKVRALSGGQRRRVEVARALLDRPALLLLDEPSTGLDIGTRRWLVEHIHHLARDHGIAVLMATHLTDEVMPEDDLIVLNKGRIVAAGRVDAVVRASGAADLDGAFTRLTAQQPGAAP